MIEWVSILIYIMNKHRTIHICTNFQDLNKAWPKDNYSMVFIDKIIDQTTRNEVLSFIDGFSNYNQIWITSTYDQICDSFLLILPHLSVTISMKGDTFFRHYIHDPSVHGNIDEISSPCVITIKMG